MRSEDTADFHIRWSWYNISRMYNLKANEFGATMANGYALLNIDKEGTPSTKLGPSMGMEATSLSRSLNKLEALKIIERKKDPNDKRKSIIHLTPLGIQSREVAKLTVIEFNENIQSHFKKEEIDTFFSVLKKINKIIDKKINS